MTNANDAIVLSPCGFNLDPRHEYWVESLKKLGFTPLRVEILDQTESARIAKSSNFTPDLLTLRSSRRRKTAQIERELETRIVSGQTTLGRFLSARVARLMEAISIETAASLTPHVVVANDLMGLIVACARWGQTETRIIYDAQEVFVESYEVLGGPQLNEGEKRAWIAFESRLCERADLIVTISPGIADLYRRRHDIDCEVLPNFVPANRFLVRPENPSNKPTRFVFIGRAEPLRGLEEVVTQWDLPASIATCDLIMPITPQRKRLESLSARTTRKFEGPNFLPPVTADQIVQVLRDYDVGILPYRYDYPYSHASPNKFGEYLAAGLALVANDQHFIRSQIEEYQLGLVFSWDQSGQFAEMVKRISQDDELDTHHKNVRIAARSCLNWDEAGKEVWRFLTAIRSSNCVGSDPPTEGPECSKETTLTARPDEWLRWHLRHLTTSAGLVMIGWFQSFKERRRDRAHG